MNGNYKWINQVDDAVDAYNNKKHRTIKMAPSAVNSSNEKLLLSTVYNNIKGYTPNSTTEIFKIREIRITNPVTYLLEDYEGNKIEGGFYEPELLKAEHPSIYLVEKILKRNGN
ncbi:uncharacterized protein LOC119655877 [Hermetia illucens]|uniref:uncharacterized protein LOC119655877 n=1 Tax=Hermetia illucens TaxID=343691 RepID=UPI0018CBF44E|nr:uncharacterized protein LOC119655877 [Hermetia illucens]